VTKDHKDQLIQSLQKFASDNSRPQKETLEELEEVWEEVEHLIDALYEAVDNPNYDLDLYEDLSEDLSE
jgi:hypothetical protein